MADRIEKDFLGEKQIPQDAYYGVQTLRGVENFHITGMPMSRLEREDAISMRQGTRRSVQ